VEFQWSALESGRRAAEHIALGVRQAGRRLDAIDIASVLPCCMASTRQEACDTLQPLVAFFAGFLPRYNRLMAESSFGSLLD
jgi:alkanesulfonate monooxygenase SsuD/methylene tetrahydromethanopterin reductase-like flavin-dependent oxidoreductase (luciferase family)